MDEDTLNGEVIWLGESEKVRERESAKDGRTQFGCNYDIHFLIGLERWSTRKHIACSPAVGVFLKLLV